MIFIPIYPKYLRVERERLKKFILHFVNQGVTNALSRSIPQAQNSKIDHNYDYLTQR